MPTRNQLDRLHALEHGATGRHRSRIFFDPLRENPAEVVHRIHDRDDGRCTMAIPRAMSVTEWERFASECQTKFQ